MEAVPHAVEPSRVAQYGGAVLRLIDEIFPLIEGFYVDLHKNPELSHHEFRTASAVAEWLRNAGYEVETGIGGTGVVAILRNGDGPTVMLRADMDALPVEEKTGLPYASTARGTDDTGADVPVMHACAHDVHTACLVGTADLLAEARRHWSGTLMVVAQPAEETIEGAAGMLGDGLYTRFGRPDVILGQHVGPQPAGMVSHRPGIILASTATLRIRVFGAGGHAAQPHTAIDPVVIAANIVSRIQAVVSREISPTETAVATVGLLRAGTKGNIIPDEAYLEVNTRALNPVVADRLISAITRVAAGEAAASGAPREPEIEVVQQAGVTDNDPALTADVSGAHRAYFGDDYVIELPDPATASEDFSLFGLPGDPEPVPYVYWFIGGTPYEVWQAAPGETPFEKLAGVPGNHSPFFAPEREATLRTGLAALTVGALTYLGREEKAAPTGGQVPVTGAQTPLTGAQAPTVGADPRESAPPAPPTDPAYVEPHYAEPFTDSAGRRGGPVSTQQADMDSLLDDGPEPEEGRRDGGAPQHPYPDPFARPPGADPYGPPPPGPADPFAAPPPDPFAAPPPPPPQGPPVAAPPPQGEPYRSDPPPQGEPYRSDPPPQGEPYGSDAPPQGEPYRSDPPPEDPPQRY